MYQRSVLLYNESIFGIICVHVPAVDSVVELLELEKVLVH